MYKFLLSKLSDFSIVGAGAEIENTIFYDPVKLAQNAQVKDKIIIKGVIYDREGNAINNGNYRKQTENKVTLNTSLFGQMSAIAVFIVIFIPSIILEVLFFNSQKLEETYSDASGEFYLLRRLKKEGVFSDYYFVLNLSVLSGLIRVIRRNLKLIGHDDFVVLGGKRDYLFDCNNFVMDKDFRIGGDSFVSFYNHNKGFFYDIVVIVRFYLSKTMQLIR